MAVMRRYRRATATTHQQDCNCVIVGGEYLGEIGVGVERNLTLQFLR